MGIGGQHAGSCSGISASFSGLLARGASVRDVNVRDVLEAVVYASSPTLNVQ
jgi:hypothetical protein